MATKKQKREAALARREAYLEELRQAGLDAQAYDKQRREEKARKAKISAEEKAKREALTKAVDKLLGESFRDLAQAAKAAE